MSRYAIEVSNVGKEYRLGERERYFTFREALRAALPFSSRGQTRPSASVDRLWALRNVSFGVEPGEAVGIIGHNGAGKSTLLKILSRITEPTEGAVELRGRVSSLLEVGTGFHPELTGRENVYLNGSLLGMRSREIAAKFDDIVAFAGVERFLDTPVKRYSTGMQVRLAFAVAAHLEPEILLVDEVLAVGDAAFQKKCLGKLDEVANRAGRTVLFVSHNMAAIRRLCRKAVLLADGAVREIGDASRVVDTYLASVNAQGPGLSHATPPSAEKGITIFGFTARRQGADLALSLDVQADVGSPRIGIGLTLHSRCGVLLSRLKPHKTGLILPNTRDRFEADIIIADFFRQLTAGSYTFDLWFADPGVEILRLVERALIVEVPLNDRFGNGHSLTQAEDGFIALDARLDQRKASAA